MILLSKPFLLTHHFRIRGQIRANKRNYISVPIFIPVPSSDPLLRILSNIRFLLLSL